MGFMRLLNLLTYNGIIYKRESPMKKTTQLYFTHFGYDYTDRIPCEVCSKQAVKVLPIEGMAIDDKEDDVLKLMALCGSCEVKFVGNPEWLEFLREVHFKKCGFYGRIKRA